MALRHGHLPSDFNPMLLLLGEPGPRRTAIPKPGGVSATVGTSGSGRERRPPVTPRGQERGLERRRQVPPGLGERLRHPAPSGRPGAGRACPARTSCGLPRRLRPGERRAMLVVERE